MEIILNYKRLCPSVFKLFMSPNWIIPDLNAPSQCSTHDIYTYLNSPSQCSDTDINI